MQRVVVIDDDAGSMTKLLSAGTTVVAEFKELQLENISLDFEFEAVLISKKFFYQIMSNNEKHRRLTRREREILQYKKEGWSNREIADNLCVTIKAVEKHTRNIKRKLGVKSILEALLICRNLTENPTIKR